jgi:hypothetical protein
MKRYAVVPAGAGLLLGLAMLFLFSLSPSCRTVQAFNQQNLIRVAEVHEVDGKVFYRRLAPVIDILP